MAKRLIVHNIPIDSASKLNKSGQDVVTIVNNEIKKLLSKSLDGFELSGEDIRRLETLTRILHSQQKNYLDLQKLAIEVLKQDSDEDAPIKLDPAQIKALKGLANE